MIEETKNLHRQLVIEYLNLIQEGADFFELKSLELEILRCEAQLRELGVDF